MFHLLFLFLFLLFNLSGLFFLLNLVLVFFGASIEFVLDFFENLTVVFIDVFSTVIFWLNTFFGLFSLGFELFLLSGLTIEHLQMIIGNLNIEIFSKIYKMFTSEMTSFSLGCNWFKLSHSSITVTTPS